MARASTTSDVFNDIAEARRRQIIDLLSQRRGLTVGAIVLTLGLLQPGVSKHLGVLREVGIVSMRKQGQNRLYDLNPDELKPVQDWVKSLEQHWDRQLNCVCRRAEEHAAASANPPANLPSRENS
jgi:DNA-binding transcriptional ArsR family regulator